MNAHRARCISGPIPTQGDGVAILFLKNKESKCEWK